MNEKHEIRLATGQKPLAYSMIEPWFSKCSVGHSNLNQMHRIQHKVRHTTTVGASLSYICPDRNATERTAGEPGLGVESTNPPIWTTCRASPSGRSTVISCHSLMLHPPESNCTCRGSREQGKVLQVLFWSADLGLGCSQVYEAPILQEDLSHVPFQPIAAHTIASQCCPRLGSEARWQSWTRTTCPVT